MPPRTAEPDEELGASAGLKMAHAADGCFDDRPSVNPAPLRLVSRNDTMELPGELLRRRREELGLTLEDLWRATKINKTTLGALEASDVVHLPAPIYTRGFVKAYAREVGLDPVKTADEYLRRIEPLRGEPSDEATEPHPMAPPRRPGKKSGDAESLMAVNHVRRFNRLAVAIAAVGLVLYVVSFSREASDTTPVLTDDAAVAAPAAEDAAAASTPEEASALSSAAALDGPLTIELIPQGPCWLSAHVDGEHVVYKLLQAGDRQTLAITDEAVLRVGEPGALTFSINGQAGRPLGRAGQPVTVRITRDNYREFLSS